MAMSGVKLTESCMVTYQDIQKSKKYRYAIFVIQGGMIEVEKVGDRNNSYGDFLADLHQSDGDADDCRYGVYDYDYQFNPDGAESTFKSKIFLMCWCPDSSKIKKKMLYSSSFDTLKRGEWCATCLAIDFYSVLVSAFVGVHKVIQANDKSECEQMAVEEILRSTDRN